MISFSGLLLFWSGGWVSFFPFQLHCVGGRGFLFSYNLGGKTSRVPFSITCFILWFCCLMKGMGGFS